ncbi:glycosyltransferase family 2 protein [Burkholderia sp. R-69980]|nr:glycosyltransferase family 2 protein [Burkholderia sp. R-69980]
MQVKDLVRDTIWLPGSSYDINKKPKVSVLLPTFRRGKSGLFRRAVESILSQTLEDIELIVVDDASTDGTADQIAEFQEKDGRVSCLRHVKNIGLPAISEYEAYLRARADRLSFAFDDTIFNEVALEKLLKASEKSPHAAIYGHVEWSHRDPSTGQVVTMRLGSDRSQGLLRVGNHIPNNAVLLPKSIIEDVGFYDPHVTVARVCDWDLWRRIAERYDLKYVDIAVGREDGMMTSDSLGRTYALDHWTVAEWMRMARNKQLRPANMGDYEVLAPDRTHGVSSQMVTEAIAKKHASTRGWPLPPAAQATDGEGYILVINVHYNASTALCFDMLPQEMAQRVRVITYDGVFGFEEMARATCVIFVRHIAMFGSWIDAAKAIGVPTYFFLDDNLPLLVENGEVEVREENYRLPKFREDMKQFEGILLSNKHLVTYFKDNLLHDKLYYFPVSFADQEPLAIDYVEPKYRNEIVVTFAGGAHRAKGLWETVVPALKKIVSEGLMIHLVTPEISDKQYDEVIANLPDGMRITTVPYDVGYLFAMRRFARFSPDFVVHAPSETKNNIYKTLNPLVAATLLNAVLVVPDAPPYDQVKGLGNVVIVPNPSKPVSWYETLKDLFTGKYDIEDIKARNHTFCAENFSGIENVTILRNVLQLHGGEVSWAEQTQRLHRLAAWFRSTVGLKAIEKTTEPADEQACELAAYRRLMRYSWRHRIMRGNSDLWNSVAEDFDSLKKSSVEYGWRKFGSSLELSDSLHNIDFREYLVNPPAGKIAAVMFAVSVDLVCRGQIGVEVVTPDDRIKDHVVIDLARQSLNRPVKFELSDVNVKAGETWKIRVFAQSRTPVYIYEFINRKLFGLRFGRSTPFMELIVK